MWANAPFCGYGFLEVWSFYMLFNESLQTGRSSITWVLLSCVVSLATVFIVVRSSWFDREPKHKMFTVVSTALNVVGSALMLYGPSPLDAVGLVMASFGNAWLWVSWGDVYCRLDTETAERSAMGSALFQVVCIIALIMLKGHAGNALVLFAAPLSCLFYCRAIDKVLSGLNNTAVQAECSQNGTRTLIGMRFIAGLGVPIALMYAWWGSPYLNGAPSGQELGNIVIAGLLVFMVAFFALIRFLPNISLPFICRVELSLVVAGCLVSCLQSDDFIGRILVYAAIIVSEYLNLLYSARLFRSGFGGAVFAFAVVQLVNHTAGWLGSVCAAGLAFAGLGVPEILPTVWCVMCAIAFFAGIAMKEVDVNVSSHDALASGQGTGAVDGNARLLEIAESYALTPRETEIFLLLAKGRSAPFIRDELVISLNTVSSHMRRIYRKMDLHSRQELLDLISRHEEMPTR